MPDFTVDIRPATYADFAPVARLIDEMSAQHHLWEPAVFRPAALGLTEAIFQTWLDRPETLHIVAVLGGAVLGYASADRWANSGSELTYPRRRVNVGIIGVSRDHRRAGIGRALFRSIEEWAEDYGAEAVSLYMSPHNEAAKAFYDALGYRPAGESRAKTLRQIKRMKEPS